MSKASDILKKLSEEASLNNLGAIPSGSLKSPSPAAQKQRENPLTDAEGLDDYLDGFDDDEEEELDAFGNPIIKEAAVPLKDKLLNFIKRQINLDLTSKVRADQSRPNTFLGVDMEYEYPISSSPFRALSQLVHNYGGDYFTIQDNGGMGIALMYGPKLKELSEESEQSMNNKAQFLARLMMDYKLSQAQVQNLSDMANPNASTPAKDIKGGMEIMKRMQGDSKNYIDAWGMQCIGRAADIALKSNYPGK